ncbi:MAG TPA: c-type cytochrome [Gemmatimonadaceae bacterium]|nr:c-type cytochrome [Gemmatimonadaceae bacterium]
MWRTNLKVLATALAVVGFYTTVAHVIPQLQSEVPEALALGTDVTPEALAAAGQRVYEGAGGCTACHGLGTRAPNLLTDHAGEGPIGARCGTRRPGMDCKAYLHESLVAPGAFLTPGFENIMPDMRRVLEPDQIWAVIAYLESQGGEVTVTAADLARDRAAADSGGAGTATAGGAGAAFGGTLDPKLLFTRAGCVGCHAIDGAGGAVGPKLDGLGRRREADAIRKKILQPASDTTQGFEQSAGLMPATFGHQLSAAQLEALVQYLASHR